METALQPHSLKALFTHYPDSVLVVSLSDEILYANPAGLRLLCRLPDYRGFLPPVLRVHNGHNQPVCLRDIAGSDLLLEIKCQNIIWQETHVRLLTLCDRTQFLQQQRELEQLAYSDELTGLSNRRGLDVQVKRLQTRATHRQQKINVLFIDVNGLKQINDTLGHEAGDAALLETAEVIRMCFPQHALKARLGGDEFAVFLLEDPRQPVHACVDTIQHTLNRLNHQPGRPYRLSISMGMSQYYPGQVFDYQQLIKLADQNMYRAKANCDVVPIVTREEQTAPLQVLAVNTARQTELAGLYA